MRKEFLIGIISGIAGAVTATIIILRKNSKDSYVDGPDFAIANESDFPIEINDVTYQPGDIFATAHVNSSDIDKPVNLDIEAYPIIEL
jgi:hypothetical protein